MKNVAFKTAHLFILSNVSFQKIALLINGVGIDQETGVEVKMFPDFKMKETCSYFCELIFLKYE